MCRSWDLKLVYFVVILRDACLGRFVSIFFIDQGLSASQIGIISGSCCISQFLSGPFWTFLADKTRNRYLILQIVLILSGLLSFLLLLPKYILNINDTNILFPLLLCFVLVYNFPNQVHGPLMDTLTVLKLGDDKEEYGKQRSMGAISWGIAHILLGIGLDSGFGIQYIVLGFLILSIPSCIVCHLAFHDINQFQKDNKFMEVELIDMNDENAIKNNKEEEFINEIIKEREQNERISICDTLKYIFKSKASIGIFLIGFTLGGMVLVVESLFFVYIEQLADNNNSNSNDVAYTYLGLSVACTLPIEIIFLYVSHFFIWHIGYRNMVHISFIAYILRVIAYTFITSDTLYLLLFIEPLAGFTASFGQIATVQLVNEIFPPKYAASAQGLMASFKFGLGPFVWVVLGGFALDYIGGKWLYAICAFGAFLVMIIFHWLSFGNKMFKAKKNNQISDSFVQESIIVKA